MADSTTVDELVVTKLFDVISTTFKGGRTESVELRGVSVTWATLELGRGTEADRDGTGPDYCQSVHDIYVISGTPGPELDGGARTETAASCAMTIPPGYRGWMAGDERLIYLEFDPNE